MREAATLVMLLTIAMLGFMAGAQAQEARQLDLDPGLEEAITAYFAPNGHEAGG